MASELDHILFEAVTESAEVPGAFSLLHAVSSAVPIHLVSATPAEQLARILETRGLATLFTSIHGAETPKKEAIHRILSGHGIKPDQAVYVGDSEGDQKAAVETGVPFIARRREHTFGSPFVLEVNDMNSLLDRMRIQQNEFRIIPVHSQETPHDTH